LEQQLNALKSNKEVEVLQQRTDDDPFISGLRDLQEGLARLQSVKIDESGLHAVTFDRKAYPPEHRIKPKRKLIVVLGLVLGLMLGVFLAFFRNFLENQRRESGEGVKE
jgi:LPS O-antigen subunit length determinant protein (WzzB/FepE family)